MMWGCQPGIFGRRLPVAGRVDGRPLLPALTGSNGIDELNDVRAVSAGEKTKIGEPVANLTDPGSDIRFIAVCA